MIKELVKVATRLDALGLTREADAIDALIRKIATSHSYDPTEDTERWNSEMRAGRIEGKEFGGPEGLRQLEDDSDKFHLLGYGDPIHGEEEEDFEMPESLDDYGYRSTFEDHSTHPDEMIDNEREEFGRDVGLAMKYPRVTSWRRGK